MNRILVVLLVVWAWVAVTAVANAGGPSSAQQSGEQPAAPGGAVASIWGTVRDAAGKPVDGALVSIRAVDQTFTTSVFTDESGEYVSPPLPGRRYRMWAQAVGFGTARAELRLDGPASQPFTLKTIEDFTPQLTGTEWYDALPDATAADRRMKHIVRTACSDCHSLAVVLQNRFDEQGWRVIVQRMSETRHTGWVGRAAAPFAERRAFNQIVRHYGDEIAAYLARVRGPASPPLKFTPQPRPRGAAAQAVITEYDVPIAERRNELAWFDGSDWSQGPAVGMHGIAGPHDVVADRAGNAWIYESRVSFETHRTWTKLDTRTGHTSAFAAIRDGRVLSAEQIEIDRDGNIWSQLRDGAMRWSPATETLTVFPAPLNFPGFLNSVDTDSEGRVWFNARYGSARLDPVTKKWEMFQQRTPFDGFSYGMAVDADDNPWWSVWNADTVFTVDLKTGEITAIPMRDPEYDARKALATPADLELYKSIGSQYWGGNSTSPVLYANAPRRLSADKRGRTVWVPNWAGMNLAEIDIRTKKVTYHRLPVNSHAYKTDVDAQHNVWASLPVADSLVKYDPSTSSWTVYPFASHGCGPRHVWADKERGDVWVPCDQSGKVARFQFRTPDQIRSQMLAARGTR